MNSSLALLGLREGFSSSELHSAYRAHVRLVHPDLATSDADRARRTRETIRLNAAYVGLRRSETPKGLQSAPQKVRKESPPLVKMPTTRVAFEVSRDSILALLGAVGAGLAASTITGE